MSTSDSSEETIRIQPIHFTCDSSAPDKSEVRIPWRICLQDELVDDTNPSGFLQDGCPNQVDMVPSTLTQLKPRIRVSFWFPFGKNNLMKGLKVISSVVQCSSKRHRMRHPKRCRANLRSAQPRAALLRCRRRCSNWIRPRVQPRTLG